MIQQNFWQAVWTHPRMLVSRRAQNRSVQTAVRAAYLQFARQHPEWVASLFDQSFLDKEAAVLFANNTLPSATRLAIAWCNQFGTSLSAKKAADIERALPPAKTFLTLVNQEVNR
jgi:hypothetical protein